MDRIFFFLQLLPYVMSCCLGADYVTVSNDVKVKPSKPSHMVEVTLSCTGSRSDLSYRLQWSYHTHVFGWRPISLGLYLTEEFSGGTKYRLWFKEGIDNYAYNLVISGVTHADDGVYRCSLYSKDNSVPNTKDVKLTVVNPVENLSLQLHSMTHSVLAQSSSHITEGDNMLDVTPGQYMVRCDASGSNPEPTMSFYYNDDKLYVSVDVTEKTDGDRMHYTGSFHMDSITLQASSSPQELVCTANIQGFFFPNKIAGIFLLVKADKPMVACENATASLGDRYAKLMCTFSAEGSSDLYCNKVSWHLSKINKNIKDGEKWSDETKAYGDIEAYCEKTNKGLKVSLELYTVKPALFEETYFVVYGIGENAHRHPVLLYGYKPMVDCKNASASLGDRYAKLMCTLSAEGSSDLYCDKVSWYLIKINRNIQSGERWIDETKAYDIIEAYCEKTTEGLKVSLELYTVKPALFDETYFVVYGIGENAYRHQVILYDVTPTGAAMVIRPLPALSLVVTALVSTLLASL